MFRPEKRDSARLAEIASIIYDEEEKINDDDKVYLMTWSPDPKKMPDCDFLNQHIYLIPYVHSYLEYCMCGVACVESTQMGNPHYHFWYQTTDDIREMGRIRWVKVMQKIGNVKITSAKYWKKNGWYKSSTNALYYYKEDAVNQQLHTPYNPIYKGMPLPHIDYTDYSWFFTSGKSTARKIVEHASQIKQLEEFYKKSL